MLAARRAAPGARRAAPAARARAGAVGGGGARAPSAAAAARGRRAAPRATAAAAAAVDVARWIAAGPVMYGLVSFNEYVAHRYYQHAEFNSSPRLQAAWRALSRGGEAPKVGGGGHVEHHAETLDDMSLRVEPRWRATKAAKALDDDLYRGTAFSYETTRLMLLQQALTSYPVLFLMGFGLAPATALVVGAVGAHALVWNALHPPMHGLPDVPASDGVPGAPLAPLRDTAYFRWIYANHEGHHIGGGRCNYNVCCPGMDHLMGTYTPPEQWRPNARLPEREAPRPQYVAGEYATACALADAEAAVAAELETVAA